MRDFQDLPIPHPALTIYPADSTQSAANGLLNVLRTVFALREVFVDDKNALVIRDSAENVGLAEKLVELLGAAERPPGDPPAPTAPQ